MHCLFVHILRAASSCYTTMYRTGIITAEIDDIPRPKILSSQTTRNLWVFAKTGQGQTNIFIDKLYIHFTIIIIYQMYLTSFVKKTSVLFCHINYGKYTFPIFNTIWQGFVNSFMLQIKYAILVSVIYFRMKKLNQAK